jgi:amino acid transporter
VVAVGEKALSMFLAAFIPMLLVASAYKELSQDAPDCATTFTWSTKAFGPWIGWIGGWGLAVSAVIALANVAEIAGHHLFKFLGQDDLAENLWAQGVRRERRSSACFAFGTKRFFRRQTLNAQTEVRVPDVY